MRVAKGKYYAVLLTLRLVAYTDNVELAQEALGNTRHRVLDQRASKTVHRGAIVRLALGDQLIPINTELDTLGQRNHQGSFWSGDLNSASFDLELYALGY